MLVQNLDKIPVWPDWLKQWAQACVAKGHAGLREALQGVVADKGNVMGIRSIRDELRAEIAAECEAAGFERAFRENVAGLDSAEQPEPSLGQELRRQTSAASAGPSEDETDKMVSHLVKTDFTPKCPSAPHTT